jgi:hypothetical protein
MADDVKVTKLHPVTFELGEPNALGLLPILGQAHPIPLGPAATKSLVGFIQRGKPAADLMSMLDFADANMTDDDR